MKRLVTLLLAAALTVILCACTNPLKAASDATESALESTTTTSVVLDDPSVLPTFVIYDANDNTQIALTLNPVYADWHYLDTDNTEQTITSGDATEPVSTTSDTTTSEITEGTDEETTEETGAESTDDTTTSSSSSGDASIGITTSDQTAGTTTDTTAVAITCKAVMTTADAVVYTSADTTSGTIVYISEDTTTDTAADTTTDTAADTTTDAAADTTIDTAADTTADTAVDTTASETTASSSGDASDTSSDYAEAIVAAAYLSLPTLDVDDDSEIYYNVEPAATPDRMEQTSWKAEYIGSESADAMEIYTKLANFYTLPLKADRVYQVTVIFDEENFESVGYYGTLTYMFITD